ncbi:hypothetical protein CAEBREN_16836 [Caenorhabditis brenneri]|uniref:DUF38 domain-containing protein n=1 Tax=Caenorhabditis brenneri TaxID=135651 RepID=G0MDN3_CAEBE|nr:hypothetical protein CAEBREN_16836 [Caenorhabditis brenneri]
MDYPCLRCILEYLEANQRLHCGLEISESTCRSIYFQTINLQEIPDLRQLNLSVKNYDFRIRLSSRCPSIRKIERLTPLHLKLLDITSTTIRINECRYEPKKRAIKQGKGVVAGDIVFSNQTHSEDHSYHYRIKCSLNDMKDDDYENDNFGFLANVELNEEALKRFPGRVKLHHAMRWLGNFLLGGRTEITTRKLEIVNTEVLRLPVDFKIKKVDILETRQQFLDGISKFINPEVEELVFSVYTTLPIRDHPLIQKAKKICMKSGWMTVEELSFVHKNIEIQPVLPEQWFEILVEKWLADGRDIGTRFSFGSNDENVELELWYRYEKMLNGRTIYSNFENPRGEVSEDRVALQEELRKSHGVKDGKDILYCICLPMRSQSELQISLSRGNRSMCLYKVVMEVVPFELWPTLKSDHFELRFNVEFREVALKLLYFSLVLLCCALLCYWLAG